jgi:hypothetical protein
VNDHSPSAPLRLEQCPGCGTPPGELHLDDCHHVTCLECGRALFVHALSNPAALGEVARSRGWWTTATGSDEPLEDYTRVLIAIALDQVTWDPKQQKYVVCQVDDDELDRTPMAIADPRRAQTRRPRPSWRAGTST